MGIVSEKLLGIIQSLFMDIFGFLFEPFKGLRSLKKLIYGTENDEDSLVYNTFHVAEIEKIVSPGVDMMWTIAGFFIIAGIIYTGVNISKSELNPSNRTSFIEMAKDWFIVILLIGNLHVLYDFLFSFNAGIVEMFSSSFEDDLDGVIGAKLEADNFFSWLLIKIMVLGIWLWANFYYLMRKITLFILLILGPLFISLWIFQGGKRITLTWFRELFGTIMIQSVHAMTFWTIGIVGQGFQDRGDTGIVEMAMLYMIVIPAGEAIRGLFNLGGDTANNFSKMGAMAGGSALAGMYGSVKGALNGKGVVDSIRSGAKSASNAKSGSASGSGTGAVTGTTSKAESMLKAGQIVSKAGKMAIGSMGAIAGSPMGAHAALAGSVIGSEVGDKAGGLAGRGVYAASSAAKSGLLNAAKKGDSEFAKGLENDRLAGEIGSIQTDAWAKQNEESVKDSIRKANPGLTESEVDQYWGKQLAQKRNEFTKKAHGDLTSGHYHSDKKARAIDLANQFAKSNTDSWAASNKSGFIDKMKQDGYNDQQIGKAWDNEYQKQYLSNLSSSRQIANELTEGKPLDSFVDKHAFATLASAKQMDGMKEPFKKTFLEKNPNATSAQIEVAWDEHKAEKMPALMQSATNIASSVPSGAAIASIGPGTARAGDLAQQVATDATKQWSLQNKEGFIQNFKQEHGPKVSQMQIENAWSEEVQSKFTDNLKQANAVALDMTDGKSMGTFINREQFGSSYSAVQLNTAKNEFVKLKQSEGFSPQAAIQEFNSSGAEKVITGQVMESVTKVPALTASRGFEIKEGIAHQVAGNLTNNWSTPKQKEAFTNQFNKQYSGEGPAPAAMVEQAWSEKVGEVYNGHLQTVQSRINAESVRGVVMPSTQTVAQGIKGFAKGMGSSVLAPVKMPAQVIKDVAAQGQHFVEGTKESFSAGNGIFASLEAGKAAAAQFIPANATVKQEALRNGVSFAAGVIGGVGGYHLAAQKINVNNPYNRAVEQTTMEVSDIARFVNTEEVQGDNGQTFTKVADGAIQLVVEKDRSYVQVQGKDQQMVRVSKYGAGDSSLQDGQVLFQDYTIEDGAIAPRQIKGSQSNIYMKDTAGHKVLTDHPVNINANELIGTRREIHSQQTEPTHSPYNRNVLDGSFTVQDFMSSSADQVATVVVERDRSYVSMRGQDNKVYRISEMGPGNGQLAPGQVQYKEYVVENAQFTDKPSTNSVETVSYQYGGQGEKTIIDNVFVDPQINPNNSIGHRPNQRLAKREALEKKRFKQGVT